MFIITFTQIGKYTKLSRKSKIKNSIPYKICSLLSLTLNVTGYIITIIGSYTYNLKA